MERKATNTQRGDVIRLEGLHHTYLDVTALADVSLRVAAGESVALIGPSGCGKSTLLKAAIGVLWPREGRVIIAGHELRRDTVRAARQHIGYVIQSGGLFPHLTAVENVTLAARHFGRDSSWIARRVDELADLVRLPRAILNSLPGHLSGGQSQRVSLMRALMLDPAVLLLDEPLGALDPMVRHELQEDLRQLFQSLRKTVLLVTHDMAEAAHCSERLVLMREGHIVQEGSYRDLATAPAEQFVYDFVRAQRGLHGVFAAAS